LNANAQVQQAQGTAVSISQAAAAIVGAIVGSSLLSVLIFYLCLRYKRSKRRAASHRRNMSDLSRQEKFGFERKEAPAAAAESQSQPPVRYPSSLYSDTPVKPQNVYVSERRSYEDRATLPGNALRQPPPAKKTIGVATTTSGPSFARFPTPKMGNGAFDKPDETEVGQVSGALKTWLGQGTTVSPFGTLTRP